MHTNDIIADRPQVDNRYLWEFSDDFDWHGRYALAVHRIIHYAPEDQWQKLIEFYGEEKVKQALRENIFPMPEYVIEKASRYFHMNKNAMPRFKKYKFETFENRPKVDMRAFWDFDLKAMTLDDWHAGYKTFIQRIIEYVPEYQWTAMVDFYGEEKIKHALLHEIYSMARYAISHAAFYFNLNMEDMRSYKHHVESPNLFKYWRR